MADGQSTRSDRTFFVTVMVLLVIILATLAALWMIERRARITAQRDLGDVELQNGRLKSVIQQMVLQQAMEKGAKIAREDLPTQTVQWNGQPKNVLMLSASTGQRLGLEPGDVILISGPAASAPASTPTSASSPAAP